MKTLFGGSSGSTSQNSSSANGYSSLPPALQSVFTQLGTQLGDMTNPANPGVTSMFTPTPISAPMQGAVNNVNAGFAPNSDTIKSDMSMQMNPYMDSVIAGVNKNAAASGNVMNQALANTGVGPDSNRSILGANDIQQSADMTIGNLLSGQFNTAMNNALTTLPTARANDASNVLSVGQGLQTLQNQTNLSPITALLTGLSGISPFTAGGTSTDIGSGSTNSQNGIFKSIGFGK